MSTLPGGRLAPQPPVTRVAAGGLAFLIAAVFCFIWAGLGTLIDMTDEQSGVQMLHRVLREPYRNSVIQALREQPGSPIAVNKDLVNFSIDRGAAADINVGDALARQRAVELYEGGFPEDPGVNLRTETIFPRSVVTMFNANRHKNLQTAQMAALIGMATGGLLCAVIAIGAARFLLPGAAALLGWGMLEYHVRLVNFWVERNAPGGQLLRGRVQISSFEPGRNLMFIATSLLVAGMVFRALRGPMQAVLRGSEKKQPEEARS